MSAFAGQTGDEAPSGLVLAIDTTGERCAAALFDTGSGTVLARADPQIGRGHAEQLMGILADVLAQAGRSYADIGRIAVNVGPGSFTGIRVGVSAARGLALALGVRHVGVDALTALAEPHCGQESLVLASQDARRGEAYAALFASDGRCVREPQAIPADGFEGFVGEGQTPILVVGSAAQSAAGQVEATRSVRVVDPSGFADIAAVARIGAGLPQDHAARPLYLRSADAKPQAPSGLFAAPSRSHRAPNLR